MDVRESSDDIHMKGNQGSRGLDVLPPHLSGGRGEKRRRCYQVM